MVKVLSAPPAVAHEQYLLEARQLYRAERARKKRWDEMENVLNEALSHGKGTQVDLMLRDYLSRLKTARKVRQGTELNQYGVDDILDLKRWPKR